MTYERVTVVLTEDEMKTLRRLAQQELRRPRDQASYILRSALLGTTQPKPEPATAIAGQS